MTTRANVEETGFVGTWHGHGGTWLSKDDTLSVRHFEPVIYNQIWLHIRNQSFENWYIFKNASKHMF